MDSKFDFSKFELSAIFFCDDCKRFRYGSYHTNILEIYYFTIHQNFNDLF